MPIPVKCQPIESEIEDLEQQKADAWVEVHDASARGDVHARWAAAHRAADLTRRIQAKFAELDKCIADHTSRAGAGAGRGTATTALLDAVFTCDGTCTIDFPGTGVTAFDFYDVALDIRFNADRTTVEIMNFPTIRVGPVTLPKASPVGGGEEINIDVTMSEGGSGFYDKASGSISIALALFADVDRDWWFIHEDSKVPLTLSTEPPGSNVDNAGNAVLAGDGRVASDILNPLQNRRVTLVCSGRITPHP